eukprot:2038628-Rhodomonas_salina.2
MPGTYIAYEIPAFIFEALSALGKLDMSTPAKYQKVSISSTLVCAPVSGTEMWHAFTRSPVLRCYAKSGTELWHTSTRSPVLSCVVSGTDKLHPDTRSAVLSCGRPDQYAECGTELRCAGTRRRARKRTLRACCSPPMRSSSSTNSSSSSSAS